MPSVVVKHVGGGGTQRNGIHTEEVTQVTSSATWSLSLMTRFEIELARQCPSAAVRISVKEIVVAADAAPETGLALDVKTSSTCVRNNPLPHPQRELEARARLPSTSN